MEHPERWFHGTRRGFTTGGALLPRDEHAGPGTAAPLNPGYTAPADTAAWVYLTQDVNVAWAYAWVAPGRGRPKVVEVIPHGNLEPDPEHSTTMYAWRCEWAKVCRVHKTPAITEAEAAAGWVT